MIEKAMLGSMVANLIARALASGRSLMKLNM